MTIVSVIVNVIVMKILQYYYNKNLCRNNKNKNKK